MLHAHGQLDKRLRSSSTNRRRRTFIKLVIALLVRMCDFRPVITVKLKVRVQNGQRLGPMSLVVARRKFMEIQETNASVYREIGVKASFFAS